MLADLLEHMRAGFARYNASQTDSFGLDGLIHHYKLATNDLWKFCELSGVQGGIAPRPLQLWQERGETPDWWQAGERTRT